MENVVDLDGLIKMLEEAKRLRETHGNLPVTLLANQEMDTHFGHYLEERDLPSEFRLAAIGNQLAVEIHV